MGESSTVDRRQKRRARLVIAAASLVAALAIAAIVLCGLLDVRSPWDVVVYYRMLQGEFHPIWKDLTLRRLRIGDDLADTIRNRPPTSREETGPFTSLLYSGKGSPKARVRLLAVNGALIRAAAYYSERTYVFFESPSQTQAFYDAKDAYVRRRILEDSTCRIHRAIKAGQDVFISRRIERREITDSNDPRNNSQETREFAEIYGADFAKLMLGQRFELIVDVSEVLSGDLKPGTQLTFSNENCDDADLAEPQTVFLHVKDSRTIRPDSRGGEFYTTVSGEALAWYRSLTPDQIEDLEARCLARETKP